MFRHSRCRFLPKATRHELEHSAITVTSKGLQIRLHVKPNSRKEGITEVRDDCVNLAVAGQPRNGEANLRVIELMRELLGLKKRDSAIISGQKSRAKVLLVHSNISSLDAEEQLEARSRALDALIRAVGR